MSLNDTLIRPLSAKLEMAMLSKALEPPEGGWTAESFARDGVRLMLAMHRQALISQRRAIPVVARQASKLFKDQLEQIIQLATRGERAASLPDSKRLPDESDLLFGSGEQLWIAAMNRVFEESGIDAVATIVPPVQSVLAQGYSRTSAFLGQTANPDRNPYIARRAQEIAQSITRINDTTRERFRRVIERSIADGDTVSETARALRKELPNINASRQLTIARTELNNAYSNGAVQSFKESSTVTHLSVIGCEAREANSPQFQGVSTCNIKNIKVSDVDQVRFHINHTGSWVPTNFRRADGSVIDPGPVS